MLDVEVGVLVFRKQMTIIFPTGEQFPNIMPTAAVKHGAATVPVKGTDF